MVTELIGEEIYDEFDPHDQGAQLSSFIPPDSDAGGTVPTIAINDPGRDDSHHHIHPTGHGIHAPNLGSGNNPSVGSGPGFGHGPAIIKPIALRAKEGFGALTSRSKSAPPIPRDQVGKPPPSQSGVSSKIGSRGNHESTAPPVEVISEKIDGPSHDLANPVNLISIPGPETQPLGSQPQTPMHESAIPPASTFGPHLAVPTPSRNASPASLEAYFLERKRRGVSGGGVTPRVVTPALGVKGKGFKSSPLSPAERDITDGAKRSKSVREGDGSVPTSAKMVEDDGLS